MCFSASASFAAGAALSIGGGATLKKVKEKREIPFALIPLFFGIQQLIEGVVWLSFGDLWLNKIATYGFTFFAYLWWPIFLPISVFLLEKNQLRKKILKVLIFLGALVASFPLYLMLIQGVNATIVNHSIQYNLTDPYWPWGLMLYFFATCGSFLASSYKTVRILGIVTFISAMIAAYFYTVTFASVWCFFAAILSVFVFLHFRQIRKADQVKEVQ